MSAGCLVLGLRLDREDGGDQACLAFADPAAYPRLESDPGAVLHPGEATYFASLEVPKRRRDYLLGRFAAKRALAGIDPALALPAVEIRPGVFQQPVVNAAAARPWGVCITHSGEISAAAAFPAGHPLGIDVEMIDPGHLAALRGQAAAADLPPVGSEAQRYTRAWTVKESLSKILGCGLTTPFSIFALADTAMDGPAFVGGFANFRQYRFLSLATPRAAFALVHPARTRVALPVDTVMRAIGC